MVVHPKFYLVLCNWFACPHPLSCLFGKMCQEQSPRGHGCRSGNDPWNSHWCTREGKKGLARKLELSLLALYSPQSTKRFFSYGFNYKLRSNWGKVLDFFFFNAYLGNSQIPHESYLLLVHRVSRVLLMFQNTRGMQFFKWMSTSIFTMQDYNALPVSRFEIYIQQMKSLWKTYPEI